MEHCIDIYSKLIIATITFTVPVIINLLSSFTAGESRRKELFSSVEENISKQTAQELQSNPEKIKETIAKTHQQFQLNDKKTTEELKLLNPIEQFWRIAIALFISIVSLMVNYLIRSNTYDMYNHYASVCTLLISTFAYCVSLYFIIRVLYTITKTKKLVDQ